MDRRKFLATATAAGAMLTKDLRSFAQDGSSPGREMVDIVVDLAGTATSLPHFWEAAAGSDRTAVGLRDQWRQDLVRVRREAGIQSIRCHGVFDDELGIAARWPGTFNFNYLDQVYDFMLDNGVRPFVELSFMPEAMSRSSNRIFFYKGNVSPPRRWEHWRDLVQAFTGHCVRRYGVQEVRRWSFEVWNEPNLNFWAGTQDDYFELYRQATLAIKHVDPHLRVGGPATAELQWIPDLIRYCSRHGVPLDFVSTHVYPGDPQTVLFGKADAYPYEEVIPRGLEQVQEQIRSSAMPHLPLFLTEWSSQNPAFIAHTLKSCIGLADVMSYWTFSNVFEEQGPPMLFNSGFGMLDQRGIARPSLHAFALMHRLGETRVGANGPSLATRRTDGSLAILVWNLIPEENGSLVPNGNPMIARGGWFSDKGPELRGTLRLPGWRGSRSARLTQVNAHSGSAYPAWVAMGSPTSPNQDQLAKLRRASELPPPTVETIGPEEEPQLILTIPANGVILVEIDA